uniref:ATP-dependent helicase n=1 Tax=Anaerococcus mediterraneensis TaxID=1870984 RepID=UPI000930A826|nr:ATP-dependent helicase [Anaerococcus mediterraneensis]
MKLTKIQNQAASHIDGPCLVLAVPGAGKTTMLLERIKNLKKLTNPKKILTLTFSKSQSIDMKNRYGLDDSNFMTIHAFCYLIIRNYLKNYNKNLRLIESDDSYNKYDLIRDIYFDINNKNISREDIQTFFTQTSYMKNAMLDESYLEKIRIKNVEKLYHNYENFKKSHFLIDFDDMQVLALKILEKDPKLLRAIQNKYDYFQLDEGQDTSVIQFEILKKIVSKNNNLIVVTDDDQSIYSFRAANPSYLLNFSNYYKNPKIIIMNENHRSGKEISKNANEFIEQNNFRYKKDIIPIPSLEGQVIIKVLKDTNAQYGFIKKHINPNQTNAILFRNNISAINIVTFLLEDKINFTISPDFLEYFKSQIVDDFFDIIKFANDFYDTESFSNIYYKIKTYLKKSDIESLELKPDNMDVFDYFYDKLDYDQTNTLYDIEKKLNHIKRLDLDKQINYIYKYMGYMDYTRLRSNKFGEEIMNKDLFVESLINFTKGLKTINDFDNKLMSLKKQISLNFDSNLILSTIHRSKGLEYENVFIIDLIKNEFPVIDYDEDPEKHLEEERRIMYVGMTRAKEKLYLLSIKKRNNKKTQPSEFFSFFN